MTTFRSPKVKRGRITNARTNRFLSFVYNPASIKESKVANHVIDQIPGDADPLIRWASGGVSQITFDVNLDGDGRLRRTGVQLFNGSPGVTELDLERADATFSVAGEIEFFEQFLFPVDPDVRGGTGTPDRAILTIGRRYQGTVCFMAGLDINIIEFDTQLNPSKAQLSLTLLRRYEKSRFSGDVWDIPEGLGLEQQAVPIDQGGQTNGEQ